MEKSVLALFDSGSKVNTIHLIFTKELGLPIRLIDVETQKIANITLNIYKIVVAVFLVMHKINQVRFSEKTFLVANVSPERVFGMFFLNLSDADIDFLDQELWWRT